MGDRAEDLNEWRSEQYAKNTKSYEPKIVLTINEAKNIYHDFASMYVIAKGTYPKDGMRKPFTLDILKMEIEKAEKRECQNLA